MFQSPHIVLFASLIPLVVLILGLLGPRSQSAKDINSWLKRNLLYNWLLGFVSVLAFALLILELAITNQLFKQTVAVIALTLLGLVINNAFRLRLINRLMLQQGSQLKEVG